MPHSIFVAKTKEAVRKYNIVSSVKLVNKKATL